ncbi:hypothetical protein [Oceanobacillus sp. FSL W7-1293]|uniref:hypothetical protein n=1 Tax=Oceanobacillus TaxID=182709 RepID=UPI0030CD3117
MMNNISITNVVIVVVILAVRLLFYKWKEKRGDYPNTDNDDKLKLNIRTERGVYKEEDKHSVSAHIPPFIPIYL